MRILSPVDQQTARCMTRVRSADEWQPINRWLCQSLSDMDAKLRNASGEELTRLQGRAQCLAEILDKFDEAREINARHENAGIIKTRG